MRQPVVVAVPSCSSPLPSARRYVAVQLLSEETLYFDVEAKGKVKDLYAAVVQNMSSLGMKSAELFGLAVCLDNEYLFVDPDNKLGKYAPKAWKASHTSGLDNSGNVLLVLYFRVQFYVDSHLLIRDRVTRRHYYLQLRENVLRHGQPASEESFFLLAALALQSDLGDFTEDHSGVYFNPHLYFPAWILERVGEDYVVQNIPAMHRDHQGLSRGSAELAYIKEASSGEAHHGLHLYRLRHSKKSDNNRSLDRSRSVERPNNSTTTVANTTSSSSSATVLGNERNTLRRNRESRSIERERDLSNSATANGGGCAADGSPRAASQESATEGNVWLGICARGIDIYEEGETVTKSLRASFLWPNIGKLCFERKKFEIRAVGCPDTRKFTYYTSSDDKSKHLLYLCRVTHQFSMAMQPRLAELRKLEEEAHRHYRESCFPNETSVLDWPPEPSSVTLAQLQSQRMSLRSLRCYTSLGQGGKVHNDQRISVISNTSSNTTSGIVSDKVQSVDESEDDFEVEIMINAPPAPSLESLALAHLRDNGSSTDSLPKEAHGSERSKEERENNVTLPRKLAGLARFARVGRKSGTSGTSHQESVDHSRAGSLQSSSSQYSASTIHSRSRSKSRLGTWGRNAASSWLYDTDQPQESIDIVDGVNSMEVMSDVRRTAVSELRTANDFTTSVDLKRTDLPNGVESSESGTHAPPMEEPQYWYSCDDDASETCSTTDNCAGATCAECRLVRVGSQHDCCSSPTQVLRHDTGPSGISLSSTSSLCVSVGHTAQNSTLSDCHSVFHSYVSSMDSNGPNVSSHELDEEDDEPEEDDEVEADIPPEGTEPTESPLTATVSAVRSPSPLSQRQRPSSRKHSDSEPNYVDFYPNSLPDAVSATPSVSAPVDYSVRSGPSNNVVAAGLETSVETLSSKLDFTVTSAVPNTGTYSRRSTVSHTLDTDSDYVQLPPLEKPLQLDALSPEGLAKSVSMSNILSQVPPPSPEKRSKNPKLNVPSSTAAVVLTSTVTPTGSNSNTLPKSYRNLVSSPSVSTAALVSEASARFITSKPPISVLQAHATPANTSSPSFAIMTASPPNASPAMTPSIPTEQYLPPPPYDPRVYLPTTTSAAMTPGSTNEITLTNADAFFSHQNQPLLPFYGAQQVEPPPPLYPAALHAFNHLQLIEQSLDPDLLQAVSAPAVSTPLPSSGSHARSRNTLTKSGNTLLKSSASCKSSSQQPSNYGQMATAYPAYAEDMGSSYQMKDSNTTTTTDASPMVPVIGKNNYLDVHASNTLSRRPPHPLPQEVLAAQSANIAHAPVSVQSNNLNSHLAAQARVISGPEEDQYLGIPPPPQYPGKPSLATVYTNQVTQSQIEQFKAQLYSDVDYVIYPLKDPALSRQEYMDAKQGAMLAQAQSLANLAELESAAYLPPPPPYRAPKTANLYRSAPNVFAAAPQSSSPAASHSNLSSPQLTLPVSNKVLNAPTASGVTYNLNPHQTHYASNQSLSSSNYSSSYSTSNYSSNYSAHLPMAYVPYPSMNAKYLSTQSLASSHSSNPSGYSASTQSLTGSYEPIGEDYLARLRAARKLMHPTFPRVQSEESILSYDTGVGHDSIVSAATTQNSRYTTTPAMKPPPPYRKQSLDTPVPTTFTPHNNNSSTPSEQNSKPVSRLSLDINTLREKSKNLDLPLISALCNDPALLNPNRKPMMNGAASQASTPNASLPRNSAGKPLESAQQPPPVANIQSMPLPPTPLEALQGKTQGQPVARQAPPVASKAYVMPKHPPGSMTVQPESAVPRRLAMSSRPKASHHQTRPLSWHSDNVSKAWSAVNVAIDGLSVAVAQPVQTVTDSHSTSESMSYVAENTVPHPQQVQQQPPPLPPPNPGSIAEAKLKAIHLLANSEDGSKKPLHLASLTKAVKNSYTVSPNRKYPVSGLYAVSELGKSSGLRKVSPTAFSHPHGQDTNVKMSLNVNNAQPQTKGAMTAISNTKAVPNKYSEGRI